MSERLPRVTAREVLAKLKRAGWYEARQTGSHIQLRHPEQLGRVTVPKHAGETIKARTMTTILHTAHLSYEEFRRL